MNHHNMKRAPIDHDVVALREGNALDGGNALQGGAAPPNQSQLRIQRAQKRTPNGLKQGGREHVY